MSALLRRNHAILCAGRSPEALQRHYLPARAIYADLTTDTVEDWLPRLAEVDAVINAAGAMRADLKRLQHHGPCELFAPALGQ